MTELKSPNYEPIIPVVFEPKSEKQTQETENKLKEQEKLQAEIEAEVKNAEKQKTDPVN